MLFATIMLFLLCFKTIIKTVSKSRKSIDNKWIERLIIRREIIRLIEAALSVVLGYGYFIYNKTYPQKFLFALVATISLYLFTRSFVHIIMILCKNKRFKIKVETCARITTEETGFDLESSSVRSILKTNVNKYTFYGYGPSAWLCSNIESGDKVLIVRFNKRKKPYMIIGISKKVSQKNLRY